MSYPAPSGAVRAYLAAPVGDGPWPGVVVLHEAFGLNADIRAKADHLAEHGYLALAPDLYSYGATVRCLVATFRTLTTGGGGRALADIDAARDHLISHPGCSGKVGVIGFCMGGGFALLAATRGYDAAAPHYGPLPRRVERSLRGACPVVASYGAKDRGLRGAAATLERVLTNDGVDHDVKEYPTAGHGFMSSHGGRWSFVERVPGFGYVGEAHDDAWRRVLAFFEARLR